MHPAFHVPAGGPYLLCHSAGCLPVTARDALEEALFGPWAAQGGNAWPAWLDAIEAFRDALTVLFGGAARDWCPVTGVSAGIFRLLSGIGFAAGRTVILASRETFPSVGFALGGLARLGLRVELIEGDPSRIDTWQRVRDPDVAAVVMMHVHSNSGLVAPVAEVAALARTHGVFSLVDVAQSAGILPIDVAGWGVDALVGSSIKWLCGGSGACYLWIDPRWTARIAPLERGWFSHENPFEMNIAHFRFASDARRFWGGTPSVAPYVVATTGLRTIAQIGVDTIRAHNLRLAALFAETAPARLADQADLAGRGGTLCLTMDAAQEAALCAADVRFDRRGTRIRLSFGIWNDARDVAIVTEQLRSVA